MKYNFDEIINRKGTDSVKWDAGELLKKFGITERFDDDTIPLFVADMDFATPPAVLDALRKRIDQRMFGYTTHSFSKEYIHAIQSWFKRRQNWDINKDDIIFSPGTVHAVNIAVRAFTKPGDGVIIQRPVYAPFTRVIEGNARVVINNELINNEGFYTIDFDDLEKKASQDSTTMMVLCSPHNPVGRIWNPEELKRMVEICKDHDLILISDEIHGDLIRTNEQFFTVANVIDYDKIVICTAINKTFNLAGLHCSNIIIEDPELKEIYSKEMGMQLPSPFSISALIAAYNEGEEWLEELKIYLDGNFDFLEKFLQEKLPQVKYIRPQGTYIAWLEFSNYKLSPEEVHKRIYVDANVVLEDGVRFGIGSEYFQRICIPTQRYVLQEAMERISKQFPK